ncbi:hypothetical protein PPACK8108_LOCUS5827 [Phakopsora pachyrhizi]|uniref:Uncharacterized protein n=1 Tax=Phakopsora pachyrhizi TaxID=170000 RepID=A0AAV0AT66_PHAPC|nr:hypothetical protein PPACK8108_LOCUS5827 [Phakopsora pachyrhizi]
MANVLLNDIPVQLLLDGGAFYSIVGSKFLNIVLPDWKNNLLDIPITKFKSASGDMKLIGIIETSLIFPHPLGSVRIQAELVVMDNATMHYFILGNEYQSLYGIDINNSKERYFTIGNDNKRKKFAFPNIIKISIEDIHKDPFFTEIFPDSITLWGKAALYFQISCPRAAFLLNITNPEVNSEQIDELKQTLFNNKLAFYVPKEPIGETNGHEISITLEHERPYPPVLRRPAYPVSPHSRIAIEADLQDLQDMNILRKFGHNEVVKITTPVIIAWHNGKSRMPLRHKQNNKI